ncbi:enoyl-CoA hydratase [Fonsecaea erecta]|uniref:Enoyl-CoA hydratase n=1 Tax=Fonsecaea erecta TaxID=1367422 RepID=A0A178ZRI0_9EURO|nr:enoyl-CoA hydratase [Fonsecaea erecta]OAP62387.1 enoyl-CoA hydratase [Fonsecaea erecta]
MATLSSPSSRCLANLRRVQLPSRRFFSQQCAVSNVASRRLILGALPVRSPARNVRLSWARGCNVEVAQRLARQQARRGLHVARVCQQGVTASSSDKNNSGDIICSVTPSPSGDERTVATVTISNADRLNSLNSMLIEKLTSKLRSLASDPKLSCVVIKGAISESKVAAFSSGANIFEMAAINNYHDAKDFISRLHGACQAARDLPVVTIAQIHGLCFGGALELAAACDFRYATHESTFSMPETKFGIPSVIEARLLVNIVGWQRTKELVYLAKVYDAREMEKWGLVDACYSSAQQLQEEVDKVVDLVAANGPGAMRAQKRLVKLWEETNLAFGVKAGVDAFASMFSDGGLEPAKYMREFTERKHAKR